MANYNDTLWILTEEKPKISVIEEILKLYCRDFNDRVTFSQIKKIKPVFKNNKFQFYYIFDGAKLEKCSQILLSTVSGSSSFFDFIVFKQEHPPKGSSSDNLIMAIEEIEDYDSIENEYIKVAYPECKIYRYLSIYGGNLQKIPHKKVLFYLTVNGNIYINDDAPSLVKNSNFAEVIHT